MVIFYLCCVNQCLVIFTLTKGQSFESGVLLVSKHLNVNKQQKLH